MGCPDPPQRPVLVSMRCAVRAGDEVSPQNTGANRHIAVEAIPHHNVEAQLFSQFAGQGRGVTLAVRNFAAGQFPEAGQFWWMPPLSDQQLTAGNQGAGNDDLGGHGVTVYRRDMAVLSDEEVDSAAAHLDGWQRDDGALRRSVKFATFLDGIDAVRRVAEHAEREDHHPDIDIRWRTITFALATHSEGGITAKDIQMAADIDGIVRAP